MHSSTRNAVQPVSWLCRGKCGALTCDGSIVKRARYLASDPSSAPVLLTASGCSVATIPWSHVANAASSRAPNATSHFENLHANTTQEAWFDCSC